MKTSNALTVIGLSVTVLMAILSWISVSFDKLDNKLYAQEGRISTLESDNQTLREVIKEMKDNQKEIYVDVKEIQADINLVKLDLKQAVTILNKYK